MWEITSEVEFWNRTKDCNGSYAIAISLPGGKCITQIFFELA